MHRKRSMLQEAFGLSTLIAPVGHLLSHMPQKIQSSMDISILPLVRSKCSLFLIGYCVVYGPCSKFLKSILLILKTDIITSMLPPAAALCSGRNAPDHLSVQLIQGSIVRIRIGTSASEQPLRVSKRAGTLAKVGVRTLTLSRYFVPFAFA